MHTFGDKGIPKNWGNPRKSTPGFFSLGKMAPVTEFEDCKTDKPVKTDTSVSSFTINRSISLTPFPKHVNQGFYPSDLPTSGKTNSNSTEIILLQKFPNVLSDSPTPIDPRTSSISVRINARSTVSLGTIINRPKNGHTHQINSLPGLSQSPMFKIIEADEPLEDPYTILPPGCCSIDKYQFFPKKNLKKKVPKIRPSSETAPKAPLGREPKSHQKTEQRDPDNRPNGDPKF